MSVLRYLLCNWLWHVLQRQLMKHPNGEMYKIFTSAMHYWFHHATVTEIAQLAQARWLNQYYTTQSHLLATTVNGTKFQAWIEKQLQKHLLDADQIVEYIAAFDDEDPLFTMSRLQPVDSSIIIPDVFLNSVYDGQVVILTGIVDADSMVIDSLWVGEEIDNDDFESMSDY